MIGSLRGQILEKGPTWLLLEVAGIGYRIKASPAVLSALGSNTPSCTPMTIFVKTPMIYSVSCPSPISNSLNASSPFPALVQNRP
ncbi:hypothetical protein IPH19_03070 [Candidatus Uhrbacteria bacterium]|nr:MAG: hypothetical protein IPH19_03070 [Candidatus Uhrbacteria bacterium]